MMHRYCTDVLHLSGAEAFLRITAARASDSAKASSRPRRSPKCEGGSSRAFEDARRWTFSLERPRGVGAASHDRNCKELLARATHKTKGETQVLVAEIAPKPGVAPSIRKLPERQRKNGHQPLKGEDSERAAGDVTSSAQSTPSGKSQSPGETSPKLEGQRQNFRTEGLEARARMGSAPRPSWSPASESSSSCG